MAAPRLKLKQQRSKDRRERIVGAATSLFGRKGVAQPSLTDIARLHACRSPASTNTSRTSRISWRPFPRRTYRALYAQLTDESVGGDEAPRAQLRAIFVANLSYVRANPDWGRVFFLEIWPSAAVRQARIRRAVDRYALRWRGRGWTTSSRKL